MKKTYLNSFCARCLTLLVLALLSTNLAWGNTYTISFRTSTTDGSTEIKNSTEASTVISSGDDYVSNFTNNCSKAYYNSKNGVKLGSGSYAGTLEFNIATNYQSNIKKITVVSAKYSSDSGTLTLYSGTTELESGKTPGTDFTHTFTTATTVSSIKLTTSTKRAYITSITLETEETPTPTEAYTVILGDTKTELPESAPGTGVILPQRNSVGDYTFRGWCETNVEETTTAPTIIPAGNYQPSADITLYPVYSKTISGTVSNDFQLVTDKPSDWSGEYIIVNSDKEYAMSCKFREGTTSGEFLAKTISITDNTITSTDNEIIWTIEAGSTSGQYSIKNNSNRTYAYISGTNSTNAALSEDAKFFTFESSSTNNVWKVVSVDNSGRCFSYYSNNTSFRTYVKSTNNTGYLYKRKADGEVTYYVTLLPKNVEISSAGWATACLPFNATISDNATAYYVTTSGSTLNKVEATIIPANEGVLLKSNESGAATVTFTPSTDEADNVADKGGNYMKGSVVGETFNESGYKYYILANDATNGLGFYFKVEGGASVECAAGKAVLAVPNSASPAKEGFPFDEESTGISESMVNGQSTAVYNLNGMQVDKNYNGIVIMNGKKYINK